MKRVFTKPESEYEVSTTLPPNKELDDVLGKFAAAMEIEDSPTEQTARSFPLMNFRQRIHMPDKRDELFENAVREWGRILEAYEPTEDELVAEDQLRMFCERGGV